MNEFDYHFSRGAENGRTGGRLSQFQSSGYMKNFMSKSVRLALSVAVGLAGFAATMSGFAADTSLVTVRGHVPAVVAKLTPAHDLPATNTMQLAIGLPLRNEAALDELMREVYDPKSVNYRKFLTPEQFTEQFGPTEKDYQAVVDFAEKSGLTVTKTHGNRVLVDVKGKVSDIQNAFHVKLRVYHHPTEARDFFAPDTEPAVNSGVPVLHVQGLDNYVLPRSFLQKAPSGAKPGNGNGFGGSYIGQDFRNAYVPGTTLNGSGQMVGLLQFDGFLQSDILTYEGLAGRTNVPLETVLLDGFNGQPGSANDEVCLDIESSIAMAPALAAVVIFEGFFPDDILNSMAASNQIKQLSASWGYSTDPVTEQIYKQFALQGQTYVNCSGDGDAWVGPILFSSCEDTNTTIVGGTTLTMNGKGVSYASEQAWNWGLYAPNSWNPDQYWGTSGGISTDQVIPSWQQGISMTANHGSTTMRNVPDVALTADNVFIVADGGQYEISGGTSAATPLWAGYMALVNQQAAMNGASPIGFLAPQVYAISKTVNYTNCFHDIIVGSNVWDQSLTNFFAVPGYDLCTGLGTPNGTNLINALAQATNSSFAYQLTAPPQPYGTTMSAMNGGSPNGEWTLFIQDEGHFNTGMVSNGWSVTVTMGSPVGSVADLGLALTASAASILPGGKVTFYVSVTNYGGLSTATNVVIENALPSGSTYLSNSVTAGSVGVTNTTLEWSLGSLATNQGAVLSLTVEAPAYTTNLVDYAYASSVTPLVDSGDNSASVSVNVGTVTAPQLGASFTSTNGALTLTINASTTQNTYVQASTNLTTWVTIFTNGAPYASPFTFTDPNRSSFKSRFYRAVTGP